MDKITGYRQLIKDIFNRYKDLLSSTQKSELESVFVFDEANDTYAWLKFGWTKEGRVEAISAFVRLRDGKIWIEEDMTESGITNELVAAGVPKEDIVLAFHPPEMRQYTEFAAA